MNTCTLTHRNGTVQDHHPDTIDRFIQDPEHGTILILRDGKSYSLQMTIKEAREAFAAAASDGLSPWQEWVRSQLLCLGQAIAALRTDTEREWIRLQQEVALHSDRWAALERHLGLPENWQHLHEGAAEVKGTLVALREQIKSLQAQANALRAAHSELVGETCRAVAGFDGGGVSPREFMEQAGKQIHDLKTYIETISSLFRTVPDQSAYRLLSSQIASLIGRIESLEVKVVGMPEPPEEVPDFWIPPAPGGEAARGWVKIEGDFTPQENVLVRYLASGGGLWYDPVRAGREIVAKNYSCKERSAEYMEIPA